jgi:hypothetical protein
MESHLIAIQSSVKRTWEVWFFIDPPLTVVRIGNEVLQIASSRQVGGSFSWSLLRYRVRPFDHDPTKRFKVLFRKR